MKKSRKDSKDKCIKMKGKQTKPVVQQDSLVNVNRTKKMIYNFTNTIHPHP